MGSSSLLISGATLLPGTGAAPVPNAEVFIEDGRIAYIGVQSGAAHPRPDRVIDGKGKTLVPGLFDLHIHSTFDADMRAYIKNGITTVRFAGLNEDAVVTLRERINRNEIIGPRIFSCGPMLDKSPAAYPRWTSLIDTPEEAAATALRLVVEHEVQALLVTQQITPELLRPIVKIAHQFGRPVVGQIWATDAAEAAELGIDQIDNTSRIFASRSYPKNRLLSYRSIAERLALWARGWATIDWDLTEPMIQAMVERNISYCATLVMHQVQAGLLEDLQSDRDYRTMFGENEYREWDRFLAYIQGTFTAEDLQYMRVACERRIDWMRRFRKAGGTLVVGSDTQFGGVLIHQELKNLQAVGLSTHEVIQAATWRSAQAMGAGDSLGSIEVGKLGDVLVLNRDPLQDLGAMRDIAHVVKGGVIVD